MCGAAGRAEHPEMPLCQATTPLAKRVACWLELPSSSAAIHLFPSLQKTNGIVHIEFASSVGTIAYISVIPTNLYMTTRILTLLAPLFFWGAIHAQNTVGLLTNEAEYSQDGYTLFYPADQHTVFLIDNCGRLVHT